jgi:hypothetical protein
MMERGNVGRDEVKRDCEHRSGNATYLIDI